MDDFEDQLIKEFKREAENKLRAAGIRNVKVKAFKQGGNLMFDFEGPEEEIKKAEKILK